MKERAEFLASTAYLRCIGSGSDAAAFIIQDDCRENVDYVLKRHHFSRANLFVTSELLLKRAGKFRAQEKQLQSHFSKYDLPDLIVPSEYLIGKEEGCDIMRLFELQQNIKGWRMSFESICNLKRQVHAFRFTRQRAMSKTSEDLAELKEWFPDRKASLGDEFIRFGEGARGLSSFWKSEFPLDLIHPSNLFVTDKGIRIIDIKGWERNTFHSRRRFKRRADFWKWLGEDLI